jgi:ankyrin repeat protein
MTKQLIIFISLSIFFNTSLLKSMKRQTSRELDNPHKKIKISVDENPILVFPPEIEHKIFIESIPRMAKMTDTAIMCKYIHNLSLVNKRCNRCINQPDVIRPIINHIYDNASFIMNPDQSSIARKIAIRGTKNYVAQNNLLLLKILPPDFSGLLPIPYSVEELVDLGADVNFRSLKGYFLSLTVKNNHYTYTKQLLDLGANPNLTEDGKTALELAIKKENVAIIELLLQYNPINKGLLVALKKGNASITNLLLAKGKLTEDELAQGHLYAFTANPANAATVVLINHFFSNLT